MSVDLSLLDSTVKALRRHRFEVEYFADGETAAAWLAQQVPEHGLVGFGGSVTVRSLGLSELLRGRGVTVLDHWTVSDPADRDALLRKCAASDAYFCSANAISADGYVLNVDGNGNRVSMETFGPRHLYIVAGVNKLTPDIPAAFDRIRYAAPKNCARLGFDNPCVKAGKCIDCDSPDRACRAYLLLRGPSRTVPTTVVLIGQELGI